MRRGLIERRRWGSLYLRSSYDFTSESPRADASPLFQVFFGSSDSYRQRKKKDGAGRRVGEKISQGEERRKPLAPAPSILVFG